MTKSKVERVPQSAMPPVSSGPKRSLADKIQLERWFRDRFRPDFVAHDDETESIGSMGQIPKRLLEHYRALQAAGNHEELFRLGRLQLLDPAAFWAEVEKLPQPEAPLDVALRIIEHSGESRRLVKFLAGQPDGRAAIDDISRKLDKKQTPSAVARNRETVRQRYKRAREILDKSKSPLSLRVSKNIIHLVPMTY
jgi:hypothetical protein